MQLGAQFCLIYLFFFPKSLRHPCAHHQEKITVYMGHWYLSLCMGGVLSPDWISIQPAHQTPPIQRNKYLWYIDTAIFSWWWAYGCPKHIEKGNKYIKQNCAASWTYLQDYTGMHGQQNIKFCFHYLWQRSKNMCLYTSVKKIRLKEGPVKSAVILRHSSDSWRTISW